VAQPATVARTPRQSATNPADNRDLAPGWSACALAGRSVERAARELADIARFARE